MNCPHKAILVVTRAVKGTASNVAKKRVSLHCGRPLGHEGEHHDKRYHKHWHDRDQTLTHVFEHEELPP